MKKRKFLGLLFLLFICVLFVLARCGTDDQNVDDRNIKVGNMEDKCSVSEIWCADGILVENNKLKIIFKDSYHQKDIIKKDGSSYELTDGVRMDYLEIGDRFICGGDHELESLVLKNVVNEIALVEIVEDFWRPSESPGVNSYTKECKIGIF